MDQSVSPCFTVWVTTAGVGVGLAVAGVGCTTWVGVSVWPAVAVAATAGGRVGTARADWALRGAAMNSSAAVLTRVRAVDWGRLNPASRGVRTRRSREPISSRISPVRNTQMAHAVTFRRVSARVPSSGLVSSWRSLAQVGSDRGMGSAPRASSTAGRPTMIASRAARASRPVKRRRRVLVIVRLRLGRARCGPRHGR